MSNLTQQTDIVGQKFHRLTITKDLGAKNEHRNRRVEAICECGKVKEYALYLVKKGLIKSCGCLKKEQDKFNLVQTKHGLNNHPTYSVWSGMKRRCYNSHEESYKHYGGRGIKVCDEWKNDFTKFYEWAIANGYKKGLHIDRIDVNGNYEPSNCRFVTNKVNANNTRWNVFLEFNGERHTMAEWADITGIPKYLIWQRIRRDKMSVDRALTKKWKC